MLLSNQETQVSQFSIMMVDDDDADIFATRRAFMKINGAENIVFQSANGGEELFNALENCVEHQQAVPDVILLDINMPRMDGFDVLQRLKSTDDYKKIPIVMLTTSSSEIDIEKAYNSGASSFISKPSSLADMAKLAEGVLTYWHKLVKLPQADANT